MFSNSVQKFMPISDKTIYFIFQPEWLNFCCALMVLFLLLVVFERMFSLNFNVINAALWHFTCARPFCSCECLSCIRIHSPSLHNFLNTCIMYALILVIGSSVFMYVCCCCCYPINYISYSSFLCTFYSVLFRITYEAAFLDKLKWLTFIAVAL